jgi:tRNA(Ile)-lysidine synthase
MNDDPKHLAQHAFSQSVAAAFQAALAQAEQLKPGIAGNNNDLPRRIVIGLSGGFDSAALVVALNAVAPQLQLHLHVCHVNHSLRGRESDEDELFCQRLCELLGVELHSRRLAKSAPSVSEASLREARYRSLMEVAGAIGSSLIAVAHTRDDQVETMLFRLFRGTSIGGIIGMSPARLLSDHFALIRPMLDLTRRDCLEFLAAAGVTARQDSSNDDTTFNRNFIRHEIIPLIESRFPGTRDRLMQLRSIVEDEDAVMAKLAQEAYSHFDDKVWKRAVLIDCPKAIKRRILSLALEQREIEVTFERIEMLLKIFEAGVETGYSLDAEWEARINHAGDLVWLSKLPGKTISPSRVKVPGITLVPALSLALRVESYEHHSEAALKFPAPRQLEALVDLSAVDALAIELRQRRPGDLIQPFGMAELVRLKQFLRTHKNDEEPHKLSGLLLADASEVLWVPGVGLSEKLRVNGVPTHKLSWIELAPDSDVYA